MDESMARILVVDDDADIAGLVDELLHDEGYEVTIMHARALETVRAAVERVRPDCVLLDGEIAGTYGDSWGDAAWMTALSAPVPVIMFTAERSAADEAADHVSERSRAAGFSSVLSKPFELDELLHVVALAVSQSPFRRGT